MPQVKRDKTPVHYAHPPCSTSTCRFSRRVSCRNQVSAPRQYRCERYPGRMAQGGRHDVEVAVSTKRSAAGGPAVAGLTREKGRLLDGHKWDYEPLAAIKFHVRIRGASCVGFFSCHIDLSF